MPNQQLKDTKTEEEDQIFKHYNYWLHYNKPIDELLYADLTGSKSIHRYELAESYNGIDENNFAIVSSEVVMGNANFK